MCKSSIEEETYLKDYSEVKSLCCQKPDHYLVRLQASLKVSVTNIKSDIW